MQSVNSIGIGTGLRGSESRTRRWNGVRRSATKSQSGSCSRSIARPFSRSWARVGVYLRRSICKP